jgi:hypothetical protein
MRSSQSLNAKYAKVWGVEPGDGFWGMDILRTTSQKRDVGTEREWELIGRFRAGPGVALPVE